MPRNSRQNAPRTTLLASLALVLALVLALGSGAAPALAGGVPGFSLPDLTFPDDQVVTGSTKGSVQGATPAPKPPAPRP